VPIPQATSLHEDLASALRSGLQRTCAVPERRPD
jgi:hypothetical protein